MLGMGYSHLRKEKRQAGNMRVFTAAFVIKLESTHRVQTSAKDFTFYSWISTGIAIVNKESWVHIQEPWIRIQEPWNPRSGSTNPGTQEPWTCIQEPWNARYGSRNPGSVPRNLEPGSGFRNSGSVPRNLEPGSGSRNSGSGPRNHGTPDLDPGTLDLDHDLDHHHI